MRSLSRAHLGIKRTARLPLVTALNLDLGRRLWWPSRLARDSAHEERTAISAETIAAR
jgi:hypothetical protein